jgi:hypothetical protein
MPDSMDMMMFPWRRLFFFFLFIITNLEFYQQRLKGFSLSTGKYSISSSLLATLSKWIRKAMVGFFLPSLHSLGSRGKPSPSRSFSNHYCLYIPFLDAESKGVIQNGSSKLVFWNLVSLQSFRFLFEIWSPFVCFSHFQDIEINIVMEQLFLKPSDRILLLPAKILKPDRIQVRSYGS